MAIKLDTLLGGLPEERQEAIARRTAELVVEEATLRRIREVRDRSQQEMARKLHIKQAAVSKLERRTDMYLSTLRRYIEAMGGKLEIVAHFPDQVVKINQFRTLGPENRSRAAGHPRRSPARGKGTVGDRQEP